MSNLLPIDQRRGIASAIKHALTFARSMTDIVIQEGRPIMAKTARGTIPLHTMFQGTMQEVMVNKEHIGCYLAGYVEGEERESDPQKYWDDYLKPQLEKRVPVNLRLDGKGSYSVRYTLFVQQRGQLELVMRITPKTITPLHQLGLPTNLMHTLSESNAGFIAITGPTGSGKTATALSILDFHNTSHGGHIVTIEDPVEVVVQPRNCIVTQREVGYDVRSFAEGMREALRMSPDLMLTGEIRDGEAAEQAIQGGESGSLMLATTHGRSIAGTCRKILSYTGQNAPVMRSVLAGCMVAIVRQALVPSAKKDSYFMVADVLFNAGKVPSLIEAGDWLGLEHAIREEKLGNAEYISMNTRLSDLVKKGEVDKADALRETSDVSGLNRKLSQTTR